MIFGGALIATFVIACEARHQLLGIDIGAVFHILEKIDSVPPAQGGGQAAVVHDFDIAILSCTVGKAEIVLFWLFVHCHLCLTDCP